MTERQARKLIKAHERALTAGKKGYETANDLLEQIVKGGLKPGSTVNLGDGAIAILVDKFASKNRIGAGLGVNRFEIEINRAAKATEALA